MFNTFETNLDYLFKMVEDKKQDLMQSQGSGPDRTGHWIILAFCGAVILAWTLEQFISNPSTLPESAPCWITPLAVIVTLAGILLIGRTGWSRLQRVLLVDRYPADDMGSQRITV